MARFASSSIYKRNRAGKSLEKEKIINIYNMDRLEQNFARLIIKKKITFSQWI